MITETGQNLSILIITEPELNWQTFATWYSFYKNLPEAKVAVVCHRTGETPFVYYQWAKRLNVPIIHKKPLSSDDEAVSRLSAADSAIKHKHVTDPVLIVKPLTMATDILDQKSLDRLNQPGIICDQDTMFLSRVDLASMIDSFYLEDKKVPITDEPLCIEAKDTDQICCLVRYAKGCGKWINSAKGCPFSSAGGLLSADMTANENRVIELWRRMTTLYNAVV
jgi:hypothetical protein